MSSPLPVAAWEAESKFPWAYALRSDGDSGKSVLRRGLEMLAGRLSSWRRDFLTAKDSQSPGLSNDCPWLYYTPLGTGKESITQFLDSCDKEQTKISERNLISSENRKKTHIRKSLQSKTTQAKWRRPRLLLCRLRSPWACCQARLRAQFLGHVSLIFLYFQKLGSQLTLPLAFTEYIEEAFLTAWLRAIMRHFPNVDWIRNQWLIGQRWGIFGATNFTE